MNKKQGDQMPVFSRKKTKKKKKKWIHPQPIIPVDGLC